MSQQPAWQPSGLVRVLAAMAAVAVVAATVVFSNATPAAAEGLERFASCADLRDHLDVQQRATNMLPTTGVAADSSSGGAGGAASEGAPASSPEPSSREEAYGGDDGTNTQVEGIDELDTVDVLADGRILVARNDGVVLLDADGTEILASLPTIGFPQLSFDDARSTLWAVTTDYATTTLTRAAVDESSAFGEISTWDLAGRLVNLRRDGGRVHLVAVDDDFGVQPMMIDDVRGVAEIAPDSSTEPSLPFDGTSPVACDQVLHSPVPGGTATTLVASFDATGALAPVAATEIVGAGDNVLVTATALYVSTPSFDGNDQVVGIHRFDLDGLSHTGSGSVAGRLLNQFSLDEHAGNLRVAVTTGDGFIGRPMMEGDVSVDELTTTPPQGDALNEIVVLDLEGSLDVVGRSARFGHPGETLHGIRFSGDIAYAVTFLQTDPLYVIDMSQPTTPRILGEIEIPGFSAYLHPISPTQVIGFGPGGDGQIVARLFDISDPASPKLLDTRPIGEDSPIVYDHHALRADGDRLIVAANRYVTQRPSRCGPIAGMEAELNRLYLEQEQQYREMEQSRPSVEAPPEVNALQDRINELSECVYPGSFPRARVVVITPDGTSLGLRVIDTDATDAQRVLPLSAGYLVAGEDVTRVAADGSVVAVLR
ncbi:MAG: beta-propeller domain-containing protein [Acidimicrobiales bacterium]